MYEVYDYVVTDQNQNDCKAYFENDRACEGNEDCLLEVSASCSGEQVDGMSLSGAIDVGYLDYSDVESFVSREPDSWCRLKNEECFDFSDNGDGTATLTKYLCGAEWNEETESFITEGKILDVNIPSQLTGKNGKLTIAAIGDNAFYDNQLTSISIPNTITSIGNRAFGGNQLESLELPSTLSFVGNDVVMENNDLTEIKIGSQVFNLETQFDRCVDGSVNCVIYESSVNPVNVYKFVSSNFL